MSEIPKFAFIITGALIAVTSVLINWKKLFVFVLIGLGFIAYAFLRGGKAKEKPQIPQQNQNYYNNNTATNINRKY